MAQSKFYTLYTSQNEQLFNMLFRHQVYLEGVKSSFATGQAAMLRKLFAQFAAYMHMVKYDTMDEFTKAELQAFIIKFQVAQTKLYSQWTQQLIELLQKFLDVDTDMTVTIMQTVTGKTPAQANVALSNDLSHAAYDELDEAHQADYMLAEPGDEGYDPDNETFVLTHAYLENQDASGMYGIAAAHGTTTSNDRLWSNIINEPIPANGLLLGGMLKANQDWALLLVINLLRKGYANGWTKAEMLTAIVGINDDDFSTPEGQPASAFSTISNAGEAVINTALQHVSSEQQAAIASVYYQKYQWVSILDNRTTVICWNRNGTVYVYGKGPLPPAHWNCRSKAVPLVSDQVLHDIPTDYFSWLADQSDDFVVDVLGGKLAKQFRGGKLTSESLSIQTVSPLTLDEFKAKIKYIIGD